MLDALLFDMQMPLDLGTLPISAIVTLFERAAAHMKRRSEAYARTRS